MRRGSTSTVTLTVPEILDLTAATAVYITFAQDRKMITKKSGDAGVTIDRHTVLVRFTQSETLGFQTGMIDVQIRWLLPDGTAEGTDIARVYNDGVLLQEVIT